MSVEALQMVVQILLVLFSVIFSWFLITLTARLNTLNAELLKCANKTELAELRVQLERVRTMSEEKLEKLRQQEVHELFDLQRNQQEQVHKDINKMAETLRIEMKASAEHTATVVGKQIEALVDVIKLAMSNNSGLG